MELLIIVVEDIIKCAENRWNQTRFEWERIGLSWERMGAWSWEWRVSMQSMITVHLGTGQWSLNMWDVESLLSYITC